MIDKKNIWGLFIVSALAGLLVYLLWWRLQVSQIRFFDADEFSYLHWTAQIVRGEREYIDFISFVSPGFKWALSPIVWFYGVNINIFTTARMMSLVIFGGILASISILFGITRNWKWAILPAVILAFLPMPYDKFLEIRPDNLAILLVLIGVIGEIQGILGKTQVWWLVSGILYSASLFVLIKTLPIVLIGLLIGVFSVISRKSSMVDFLKKPGMLMFGLLVPWMLYFVCAWASGNFEVIWYSLTRMPFEVYKFAVNTPMVANLFFYPNVSFYGGYGITTGLVVNHLLWLFGIFVGTYRLLNPLQFGDRRKVWTELFIATIFFVSIFAYVKYFPLKHSQYLIPIAIFIAYYAADGLSAFFSWIHRVYGYPVFIIVVLGFTILLITVTREVNAPKLAVSNAAQLAELSHLLRVVPSDARVVDLDGRMVFWPDGYPISAMPFDSFLQYMSKPPPPLATYLSKYPADYIYQGDTGRLTELTQVNSAYVREHFAPVPGWGDRLWKRLQ